MKRLILVTSVNAQMVAELEEQKDPWMFSEGGVFEAYPHTLPPDWRKDHRSFYERYMAGEPLHPNWVRETDFEEKPIELRP